MRSNKTDRMKRLCKQKIKEWKLEWRIGLATSLLVVILNIAEIIFIVRIKGRMRIYEIILLSLSVSDCLLGLSKAVIGSIFLSDSWKPKDDLLETALIAYMFFILASILHLIFIAVDRVMIVLIPFQYETIFTRKRLKIGIALLWMLAFGISISTYIYYKGTVSERKSNSSNIQNNTSGSFKQTKCFKMKTVMKQGFQEDMTLVLSISIVVSDLVMILCYSTIIYQINYKTRKCQRAKSKKEEGLPLLCVFIAGVFVMFTLPFAIARLNLRYIPFWADCSMILNSGMNSVMYFFYSRLENYQSQES